MNTCTSCGAVVTGKKFCASCGTPVQPTGPASVTSQTCPHCDGEVNPGAAFCMHCGSSLQGQPRAMQTPPPPPAQRQCPSCQALVPGASAFCINCGQNMNAPAPPQGYPAGQPSYAQPPYQQPSQYQQPSYQQPSQYQQSQYQQAYPQGNYQGQPMVLRCPICMAISPMGTPVCPGCRSSLAAVAPMPANMPMQAPQQGGIMQGNAGKYAMGALGGVAALLGGEMLFNGLERGIENRVEGDMGYEQPRHHHHHHHREEGVLGELGDLANDVGLF